MHQSTGMMKTNSRWLKWDEKNNKLLDKMGIEKFCEVLWRQKQKKWYQRRSEELQISIVETVSAELQLLEEMASSGGARQGK